MRGISLLAASLAVAATASAQPSATTNHDVQCFMLYAAGIGVATDDKARFVATMGTMYFFGRLKSEAPDLNLEQAIRAEGDKFADNPNAKAIGEACDKEVQERGAELEDVGQRLQRAAPQSSPSSS
jgi:hypothetical protein